MRQSTQPHLDCARSVDNGGEMTDTATAALAHAAQTAGLAPSIHNTQPWRWRVEGSTLELRAERSRQLGITDPSGRMLAISCGTALHQARVALAAAGWTAEVDRVPDRADPDLLARATVTGQRRGDPGRDAAAAV